MSGAGVRRVTLVIGTTAGGTGAHVRMLAAGLAGRGVEVTVAGPGRTAAGQGLDAIPDVAFAAVEFTDRPRPADAKAIGALRRLLTAPGAVPDVVHAHGMRAGALTAIALAMAGRARGSRRWRGAGRGSRAGRGAGRGPGAGGVSGTAGSGRARDTPKPVLAVTVHNAPPPGRGAARLVYLALERIIARRADLVLAVSADLEQRMRAAGARNVERAVVPAPARPSPGRPQPHKQPQWPDRPDRPERPQRAERPEGPAAPDAAERPLVLAVGRLAPQKGFAALIDAAAGWQRRSPRPRLLIAGDGPLREELRARAARLAVDAELPGHRDDIPRLLAAASVFVMPSRWEGQPLALAEALAGGVPVVASDAGGIPELAGDAALLVEPGNAERLGQAVLSVLDDDDLAGRLRSAARRRSAALPGPAGAVTAVLAAYARALE